MMLLHQMRASLPLVLLASAYYTSHAAGEPVETQSEDDLLSFVTLPNVRALKWNIDYKDRERVAPGYWFVSPYGQMDPEAHTQRYTPYQVGPYIYDGDGNLVWVGSPLYENRNVFDFRAVHSIGDEPHLSFVLQHNHEGDLGSGMIMGNDYEIKHQLTYPPERGMGAFDIHEWKVLDDGKTGLAIAYRVHEVSMESLGRPAENTYVVAAGFTVLDLESGALTWDWDGIDQVGLTESYRYGPESGASGSPGWDYVHANSIDRNANGDYLMSMRFTDTIYLISGVDGHIIWRLGGKTSDFRQEDFIFARQHDAKFLESNGTHHVISLLNNASDEEWSGEDVSSALIVELDATPGVMTAKLLHRYNRPDGQLTRLRGNAQQLPNKNMFVGWSEAGYISEFAESGELLLSARFASTRFNTYRAYKSEFVGRPKTTPDVVAAVSGTNKNDLSTTFYVSWNGATEVAMWKFYAQATEYSAPVYVGETPRADFETMFIISGFLDWVRVDAVDRDGKVLGSSLVQRTQTPKYWRSAALASQDDLTPTNPAHLVSAAAAAADNNSAGSEAGSAGYSPSTAHQEDVKEVLQLADDTHSLVQMIGGLLILFVLLGLAYALFISGCCGALRRPQRDDPEYRHKREEYGEETIGLRSVPPQ
ncbi:ASST-domain-containing protein [Aspergillus pseudoustus]|uniref:ASST-domain-containing protein n=1 Tax=Aspergillus pseudoustus TaxID=1810923 RepID=A0ABR4JYX4_9EURO